MTSLPTISQQDLREESLVGAGGFGTVYKATHATRGCVAVKKLAAPLIDDVYKEKLICEAGKQVQLQHDNIARVYGVVWEPGHYGIVMEHAQYGGLDVFMCKYGPGLQFAWKMRVLGDILTGMTYLHSCNIIHRDLKTQNLLVSDALRIKICDFGLAEWRTYSRTHTLYRPPAGTLTHLAPEHLRNVNCRSTEKSDVYSFAIIVWEVLTEKMPFTEVANDSLLIQMVISHQRPDVDDIPVQARSTIGWLVYRMRCCWHDSPEARPTFEEVKVIYEANKTSSESVLFEQAKALMMHYIICKQAGGDPGAVSLQTVPKHPVVVSEQQGQGTPMVSLDDGVQQMSLDESVRQYGGNSQLDEADTLSGSVSEDGALITMIPGTGRPEQLQYPTQRHTRTVEIETDYNTHGRPANRSTESDTMEDRSMSSQGPESVSASSQHGQAHSGLKYSTQRSTDTAPIATDYGNIAIHLTDRRPTDIHRSARQAHPGGGHPRLSSAVEEDASPSDDEEDHSMYGAHGKQDPGGKKELKGKEQQGAKVLPPTPEHVHVPTSMSRGQQQAVIHTYVDGATVTTLPGSSTTVHNLNRMSNVQIGSNNVMHTRGAATATDAGTTGAGRVYQTASQTKPGASPGSRDRTAAGKTKIVVPSRVLTPEDMDFISQHVGAKWEKLGRKLGFSNGQLDIIKSDYRVEGLKEQIYRMLYHWGERLDTAATLKSLAKTLCEVGLVDVAFKIEEREKQRDRDSAARH